MDKQKRMDKMHFENKQDDKRARDKQRQKKIEEKQLIKADEKEWRKKSKGLKRTQKNKISRKRNKEIEKVNKESDKKKQDIHKKLANKDNLMSKKDVMDAHKELDKIEKEEIIQKKKIDNKTQMVIYVKKIKRKVKKRFKKITKFILSPLFLFVVFIASLLAIFAYMIMLWGSIVAIMLSHPLAIKELSKNGVLGNATMIANVEKDVKDKDKLLAKGKEHRNDGIFSWYGKWNVKGDDLVDLKGPPEAGGGNNPNTGSEVPDLEGVELIEESKPDDSSKPTKVVLEGLNKDIVAGKYPNPHFYKKMFSRSDTPNLVSLQGVVIHETAVQSVSGEQVVRSTQNLLNQNNNNAFYHGMTTPNHYIQVWDYKKRAWGALSPANEHFIHVELENTTDTEEFKKAINNNAYAIAKILKQNNLKPSYFDNSTGKGTLISHHDVSKYLAKDAGGHTDPTDYFKSHGYSVAEFVELVKYKFDKMAD